jgi:hypothetical protein
MMDTGAHHPDSKIHRNYLRGIAMGGAVAASCALLSSGARADVGVETPAPPAGQIISQDINAATGYYSIINQITGAERFYLAGYFGNNAMIANVEAGHVWDGHETTEFANIDNYVSNSPLNTVVRQYDYHATMVGFTMVGIGPPSPLGYFYYQFGMAPGASLTSVAIATGFGANGSFDITSSTFVYGYKTVMQDGVLREIFPGISISRPVDVVNSSWGYGDDTGSVQETMILDSLAFNHHQTVVIAAGNHSGGTAKVSGPASGFNTIAVGALGTDLTNPVYSQTADFSNTGPNDFYNPQTGITTPNVRAAVSISAPGTDLILPAYVGATGANSSGTLFDVTGIDPSLYNQLYFVGVQGTSFASPITAGGASLLVDAGYANFGTAHSVDGRVIKAVLLNSASKLPGWTNNTTLVGGVLKTSQGLDWNTGAGALNLNQAYDQYLSGTTDTPALTGGTVHPLGWAYGHVAKNAPNDYLIDAPLHAGDTFTATLTWFVNVFFNTSATPDVTDSFTTADLHDTYFDQLDLQVWKLSAGVPTTLIAESTSPYNNVDHLYFQVPSDGSYAVRVTWVGSTYDIGGVSPQADDYGLAWSVTAVPEPGTLVVMGLGVAGLLRRRAKQR